MIRRNPHVANSMRRAIAASVVISFLMHAAFLAVLVAAKIVDYRNQKPIHVFAAHAEAASVVDETHLGPAVQVGPTVKEVASEFDAKGVQERIRDSVQHYQAQSLEQNLAQLESMSEQLKKLGSSDTVDELAEQFRRWTGWAPRASDPAAAADPQAFDESTAQLHDIRKLEGGSPAAAFVAVLVDAQGAMLEVELTESEGADAYALLERLKKNPLMNKVYRRIAMPLLDDILRLNAIPATRSAEKSRHREHSAEPSVAVP